jgi:hypothetical protein
VSRIKSVTVFVAIYFQTSVQCLAENSLNTLFAFQIIGQDFAANFRFTTESVSNIAFENKLETSSYDRTTRIKPQIGTY